MMVRIALLVLSLCYALANAKSFSVVSLDTWMINGTAIPVSLGVEIINPSSSDGSTIHPMQPTEHPILHTAHIHASSELRHGGGSKYRYVLLDPETKTALDTEPFFRTLTTEKTLNEVYGRPRTVENNLSTFPTADPSLFPLGFDRPHDTLHRMNEVVTLHIHASPEEVQRIHENYLDESEIVANVTWISSDKVQYFTACQFGLSGRSTRQLTKVPYKISLKKKDHLGGLRGFKLRSTGNDPSYIREKLVYDLHQAVGRPSSLASFVRVFINDQQAGLFLLTEKYDKSWLRNEFYQGKKVATGGLYKAEGAVVKEKYYADLSYHRKDLEYYDALYTLAEKPKGKEVNGMDNLMAFTRFIDEQLKWQESHKDDLDSSVALWESRLNVKGFLANMALEFLVGTWDNYIQNAQNYYIYERPSNLTTEEDDDNALGVMDWVAWDFDYSMGSGPINMDSLLTGDYRNFTGLLTRPLTRAVLAIPAYRHLFESQILHITSDLLAPAISNGVIDGLVSFLRPDILWDADLPRLRAGESYATIYDSMVQALGDNNNATLAAVAAGMMDSGEMSMPANFDLATGIDFVLRVNAKVDIDQAIEGPTHFKSLLAVKDYIRRKVDNINAAMKRSELDNSVE